MGLIEERHPAFKRLMRLWRDAQVSEAPPPSSGLDRSALADLADVTVTLVCDDADVRIAESGDAVDALYEVALGGASAERLTPKRGGAAEEALAASRSGRPLLIEDELPSPRRRIARLYLPLSNDDGSPDGVLCGVVAIA
ncbi:MAG: hypothetical protein PGN08_05185 [Sphingomonas taxi]